MSEGMTDDRPTVGSLFSGIGGFDLAFERAGFRVVWQVEWDARCRAVLARHFGGADDLVDPGTDARRRAEPRDQRGAGRSRSDESGRRRESARADDRDRGPTIFSDVREVGAETLSRVDVLVGGWPCQPVSVAGKRRASSDERDMWPEFARIARELRPGWVVGENVPGVLTAEGGAYWGRVLDDMDKLGYGVAWATLDARYFGVPQRRRRVFLVGRIGDLAGPAEVLLDGEGGARDLEPRDEEGEDAPGRIARGAGSVGGGIDVGAHKGDLIVDQVAAIFDRRSEVRAEDRSRFDQTDSSPALSTKSEIMAAMTEPIPIDHRNASRSDEATGEGTPSNGIGNAGDPSYPVTLGPPPIVGTFRKAQKAHDPDDCERWEADDLADTLDAEGMTARTATAITMRMREGKPGGGKGPLLSEDSSLTLAAANDQTLFEPASPMIVRKLTPLECERLQGFPDGWTQGQKDGARYRQTGNAVAVPVVEWIARRVMTMIEKEGP